MRSPSFFVSDLSCEETDHAASAACTYRVAWAINPHMRVGSVQFERAQLQHLAFVNLLERLGADVSKLPFVHGAHDSVFAKDNAVIVDDCALLARPRHRERTAEQAARARALEAAGIAVVAAACAPLEGGDVVVLPDVHGALLGEGFRSAKEAAADLERFLDAPVVAVELVDARLYHLDMVVSVLSDGTAIVCEDALAPRSRERLRRAVGEVISVSVEDALTFGINMIQLGQDIVLGGPCPAITRALEDRGYRVHVPELEQFQRAGGSAACLVARRHVSSGRASKRAA